MYCCKPRQTRAEIYSNTAEAQRGPDRPHGNCRRGHRGNNAKRPRPKSIASARQSPCGEVPISRPLCRELLKGLKIEPVSRVRGVEQQGDPRRCSPSKLAAATETYEYFAQAAMRAFIGWGSWSATRYSCNFVDGDLMAWNTRNADTSGDVSRTTFLGGQKSRCGD